MPDSRAAADAGAVAARTNAAAPAARTNAAPGDAAPPARTNAAPGDEARATRKAKAPGKAAPAAPKATAPRQLAKSAPAADEAQVARPAAGDAMPPAREGGDLPPAAPPAEKATAKKATPAKKAQVVKRSPRKAAPPADATLFAVTPVDVAGAPGPEPVDLTPAATTPVDATPVEVAPVGATPENATPAQATPVGTTPGDVTPPQATPARTTPTEATPPQAGPARTTPTEATPPQAGPGRTSATPAEAVLPATAPEDARPTTAPPSEATPAGVTAAEVASGEAAPGDATSTPPGVTAIDAMALTDVEPAAATAAGTTSPAGVTPTEAAVAEAPRKPAPAAGQHGAAEPEPWAKLIADPGHAPELLALAAVQAFGPRAAEWAAHVRADYPTASDQAVARLAARQFARFGSLAGVFGALAGSYAPVALVGAAAVTHAEMVLHLAAAYGKDPADPQRAAELLVITRVHPTVADAEEALAAAHRPVYDGDEGGLTSAAWRLGRMVVAQAGAWTAVRLANHYFPGAAVLTAVLAGNASAQAVAARATAFYSQVSQDSGSRV